MIHQKFPIAKKRRGNRAAQRLRRGGTMVESAIVLSVVALLLLGMLELSLALVRSEVMAEAARRAARAAIVRGENAPNALGTWGPAELEVLGGDDHPVADAIAPILMTIDPDLVTIRIEWPDGGNAVDDRVEATVTCQHQSVVPLISNYVSIPLRGKSVMRVAH